MGHCQRKRVHGSVSKFVRSYDLPLLSDRPFVRLAHFRPPPGDAGGRPPALVLVAHAFSGPRRARASASRSELACPLRFSGNLAATPKSSRERRLLARGIARLLEELPAPPELGFEALHRGEETSWGSFLCVIM